jgi:hypothetical protein
MILIKQKSDSIGVAASTLCLIHCIATPFIFIVQSSSLMCCNATPNWWKSIDYLFLIISFLAICRSTQTTTKNWIKLALWGSWFLLFFIIINEKMSLFPLKEYFIYFPAIALIILHLYNKKYCRCNTTKCCTNE